MILSKLIKSIKKGLGVRSKINTKRIEKGKEYIKDRKSEVFKITGHPIAKESDSVKEIYIAHLISIAAYDGEVVDSEIDCIKKIINGLELKTSISKLLKLGFKLEPRIIDEFVKVFSGKDYANCFLADALILAASDGVMHDKELELISEISEILRLSNENVRIISQLVYLLLGQDASTINKFSQLNDLDFDFDYLIRSYFPGYVNPANFEYITGDVEYKTDKIFTKPVIRFENANIKIANNVKLKFCEHERIEFINCKIIGGKKNALDVTTSKYFSIINSSVESFKHRVGIFAGVDRFVVMDSVFSNCGYTYSGEDSRMGGVFAFGECNNSEISNCIFTNCYIENLAKDCSDDDEETYFPEGIFAAYNKSNIKIYNSRYKDCYAQQGELYDGESIYYADKESKIHESLSLNEYKE